MKPHFRSRLCALVLLVFVAGLAQANADGQDHGIYRWNGSQWVAVEGVASRIAVGPNGAPWVVTAAGQIYRYVRNEFRLVPGTASDIGVGGDGSVWIIGPANGVYRWDGRGWNRVDGSGVAISVDQNGHPWVANDEGYIYRWDGRRFILQEGLARDIGAGSGVWIVGPDSTVRQRQPNGSFSVSQGTATRVSAGANGAAWVVTDIGSIYKWENGEFKLMPGTAQDIAVNSRGDAWMISAPARPASQQQQPQRRGRPRR
jgi:hypothetical protein